MIRGFGNIFMCVSRSILLVALTGNTALCLPLDGGREKSGAGSEEDYRRVKELLTAKCFSCHGALKQKAGLRLDTRDLMLKGEVIVPGEAEESLLVELVEDRGEERMPPPEEGAALKSGEIALLRRWIDNGAWAPAGEPVPEGPDEHWAFQVPRRVPLLEHAGNPIDALLGKRQAALDLKTQGPAKRTILIRRLYLDLVGLPPTLEQLDDNRPLKIIMEELLASPQHGERWARHWMDVWRYSDWYGLGEEIRDSQRHLWRWRDWIVTSLNRNKGYDQMVREMLAGDEIAPGDPTVLPATGFLARSWYKFNRTSWLDNTIEHTGKAFMGLTMNCAKCHDHKYDPITHLDYYKFRAIFEPYQVRVDAAPGPLDLNKNGLTRVYDGNPAAATYLHRRGEESKADTSRRIGAGSPSFLARDAWEAPTLIELPLEAWRPEAQGFVQDGFLSRAREKVAEAEAHLEKMKDRKAGADRKREPTNSRDQRQATAHETKTSKDRRLLDDAVVEPVLIDNFRREKPELWELTGSDWRYREDALSLTRPSLDTHWLRSRIAHPLDFEATLKYRTTGGKRWKSVGIRFDVDESGSNSHWVYTSVGGSKVHLARTVEGKDIYTAAAVKMPISLDREYTLGLRVRGRLVNVLLDGEFLFACNLPHRRPGAVQLLAYDALVDFCSIEVRHLPAETGLQEASEKTKPIFAAASAVPAGLIDLAEAKLNLARAELAFVRARIDADNVIDRNTSEGLVEKAGRMHLEAKIARARLELLDPEKNAKAAETIKNLERELTEGKIPDYSPVRVSEISLVNTSNKDALPAGNGYPRTSTGRRTALANWLTHRDHPLTARVAVNHIWLRHFGTPLVESVADFGLRAQKPLLLELLDYLAVELIESGWDMKHMHRLMLSSQAWQRTSSNLGADKNTLAVDKANHHYWRMNSRRMEAQVVRDSLLHLAGMLDLTPGGPPVKPSAGNRRRSLYFFHSRDGRSRFLSTFDDADVFACYQRSESIVPQQALAMMNSETATRSAREIASMLDPGMSPRSFVRETFRRVLARDPAEEELAESLSYLEDQPRRDYFIHALINLNDFLVIR